jgi:hypothetical protein
MESQGHSQKLFCDSVKIIQLTIPFKEYVFFNSASEKRSKIKFFVHYRRTVGVWRFALFPAFAKSTFSLPSVTRLVRSFFA